MARRRKEQASLDTLGDSEPMVFAAEEVEQVAIDAPIGSVEEQWGAPAVVTEIVPTKWVVMEDAVVSLFGQMTLLPSGTVVSAASYGPAGIKRIMEQKVALEPVA